MTELGKSDMLPNVEKFQIAHVTGLKKSQIFPFVAKTGCVAN